MGTRHVWQGEAASDAAALPEKTSPKAAASAAMLAWVLLGPGLLAMLGCSSTTTISGDRTTVEVPADISQAGFTVTCYDQFLGAWAAGTKQREISEAWDEAGAKFDDGIAVLDGCYLVACARKFGAVGDKVTFRMSDGTELPASSPTRNPRTTPIIQNTGTCTRARST